MPRKKQIKTPIIENAKQAVIERQQEEIQTLRRRLDEQADRYNMVNTTDSTQTVEPKRFLSKESQRHIRSTFDLQQFVEEIYGKGIDIIGRKNRDYGDHKNQDPFGNFNRHGLKGFLVRIDDKLARLNTFCDNGHLTVLDESVTDTIIDAANYLAIMAAYIYSKNISSNPESFKL